ncbi:nitroreductase family protein [Miltoncostaea marina]|uniref:nitroreductase family protein n=1 Tax=Miltoncostaea marina TaxID=2843215 RepID=UPI001C3E842F|nr:nitroreductase family protein [Miltoncostaea marina]
MTKAAASALRALASLRATRAFTGEPVPEEAVTRILAAARWTGSARNRQPWRVVVVRDPALRAALSRLGAYAGPLAAAPLALAIAIDRDGGGADAEFDAGRLAQNLMLAAHALNLGTCPVTLFPAANVRRAAELLRLTPPWTARTALAVGRPAPPAPRPPGARPAIPLGRMPLEELRIDRP